MTEKESKIADLFLEELLTIEDSSYAFKNRVYFFFNKHKVSKERTEFICLKLAFNEVIELKRNPEISTSFNKETVKLFLKNGGMLTLWLKDNKLKNDAKLSQWQVNTFWWIFGLAIFGGGYSAYDFTKNLTKSVNVQQKEITKEEMELELSKLRTLILNQKKDKAKP